MVYFRKLLKTVQQMLFESGGVNFVHLYFTSSRNLFAIQLKQFTESKNTRKFTKYYFACPQYLQTVLWKQSIWYQWLADSGLQ